MENYNDKIVEEFNERRKTTGTPSLVENDPMGQKMPGKDNANFSSDKSHNTLQALKAQDASSSPYDGQSK